ncbi:hypothetical protein Sgleb_29750 [Streptomyces glebosus]|uniref:TPM domain-containing protein n=1 Tax=Streptomyces glebosus TaxID=249580 RepID=A0A640SVA5_9ACTN|nr:hypothetical protein [Streptomyces glebosus]GFE14928.1 hypothetical protein Sgleb_29750 [Streptomyces glebosus]GHG61812.1 hypothetical protein GCM10010513_28370 [Streptomyces glebosus]
MCTDLLHPAGPQRAAVAAQRLRRALAAGVASVALLCCTAAPAAAAESPGQKIADALRRSPVHVDPSLTSAVDAEQQRELAARIRRTHLPIRVALVPLVEGDSWGGKPEQLAEVVHDRMGGGPAILITLGEQPGDISAREWPSDAHQSFHAAAAVFFQKDMKGAGPAKRVARAIDIIEAGNGDAVYERATADLGAPAPTRTTADGAGAKAASGHGSPLVRLLSLAVGPVLLLAAVGLLLRRRSRLRDLSTPFALPRSVFAAAREADEAGLRDRAAEEVVRLGEEARTAQGAPAAVERALDAYAAAGTVLDRARGVPDLAGVFVLVAEGRAALSGAAEALPLCFFHPLHGPAVRRIPWRPLGRREQLRVAACETCLRAIRTRRAPEVLTDRQDGRPVPYFEVPAEDSLWAATGYGSLLSGADASLAGRVQRGDFTRTRD